MIVHAQLSWTRGLSSVPRQPCSFWPYIFDLACNYARAEKVLKDPPHRWVSQTASESAIGSRGSQPTPESCGAGATQGHRLFCLSLETMLQEGRELPEGRDAEMLQGVKKKKVISSFNLDKGSLRTVLIRDVKYQL